MFHRPMRQRFASNPYTVTNVKDVWECDLLDVQTYAKYKANYGYIQSVRDVYSKFLHMIPIKTKSGPSIAWMIRSIFAEPIYS